MSYFTVDLFAVNMTLSLPRCPLAIRLVSLVPLGKVASVGIDAALKAFLSVRFALEVFAARVTLTINAIRPRRACRLKGLTVLPVVSKRRRLPVRHNVARVSWGGVLQQGSYSVLDVHISTGYSFSSMTVTPTRSNLWLDLRPWSPDS